MSEKMYTRLFRLYPSRFRKEYEAEALQLIRDRLRDETGFFKRARLLWDLAADILAGLPQAYRNPYAGTEAASLSLHAEGIPSFRVLEVEPIGRGSIFLGSTLSLVTIVAFGFLLSRSMAHLPVPGSNGRMSPIEAVVERLNRATTPDTPISEPEEASGASSVGANEQQPRPSPAPAASTSKSYAPVPSTESRRVVGGQNHITSTPTQNSNERSLYLTTQLRAGEATAWRGTLTDAFGQTVRSAEIHLIGGHGEMVARTAADGSFAFSELTSGDYEVVVVMGGREVAYLKALHLSAVSSPSRLTLASGGRLLVSRPGKLP
jgi:Carboxypeptidase regulatory-like domain